jgi:uncharacterized membrane protein YciS (DUF1049 family)
VTELLLQISIVIAVIGNIIGVSIGVFVVARYYLVIEKRLKSLEKKVGVTNNLRIQK